MTRSILTQRARRALSMFALTVPVACLLASVARATSGVPSNGRVSFGAWVAFITKASNLVAPDTNNTFDVFVGSRQ